jgi:hypothetical protein
MVAHPWKPIAFMKKKPALPGTIAKYRNTALERGFTEISQNPSLRG